MLLRRGQSQIVAIADAPPLRKRLGRLNRGMKVWARPAYTNSPETRDNGPVVIIPAIFSDGLGDIDFEGADGGEGFADALAVRVEGDLLSGSEKVDLTGEAMFVGIETSALGAGLASAFGGASGFFRKLGVVPGNDLGYCLLFVKHW
jgi:hypothetical protein